MTEGKLNEQAKGVFIIAATPFTDDGALDYYSLDTLTDFYLGCGVHGFTLLGMMGEAHKLTADESLTVVNRVVARAQGRQVIVGASHAGLENVRRLAQRVAQWQRVLRHFVAELRTVERQPAEEGAQREAGAKPEVGGGCDAQRERQCAER